MATGDDVVRLARSQIGKPYRWAAAGPSSFDCSGLVVYCFKNAAGVTLPHFTGALISKGSEVKKADLKPGDLVFPIPSHVAIYAGNGKWIEAPRTGIPVREADMWGFWRARRIISAGSDVSIVPVGGNPFVPDSIEGPVRDLVALFQKIDAAVEYLATPGAWRRIAMFIAGFILAFVAVVQWDNTKQLATKAVKVARNG